MRVSPSNCFEIQGFPAQGFFHKHFKHIGSYQQCIDNLVNSDFLQFLKFFFDFPFSKLLLCPASRRFEK